MIDLRSPVLFSTFVNDLYEGQSTASAGAEHTLQNWEGWLIHEGIVQQNAKSCAWGGIIPDISTG